MTHLHYGLTGRSCSEERSLVSQVVSPTIPIGRTPHRPQWLCIHTATSQGTKQPHSDPKKQSSSAPHPPILYLMATPYCYHK